VVSCAKTAEPIEMLFGLRIRMGPRNHVLGEVHTGATWRTPLNRSCAVAMRLFCQITLTTCLIDLAVASVASTHASLEVIVVKTSNLHRVYY